MIGIIARLGTKKLQFGHLQVSGSSRFNFGVSLTILYLGLCMFTSPALMCMDSPSCRRSSDRKYATQSSAFVRPESGRSATQRPSANFSPVRTLTFRVALSGIYSRTRTTLHSRYLCTCTARTMLLLVLTFSKRCRCCTSRVHSTGCIYPL